MRKTLPHLRVIYFHLMARIYILQLLVRNQQKVSHLVENSYFFFPLLSCDLHHSCALLQFSYPLFFFQGYEWNRNIAADLSINAYLQYL